MSDILIRTVGRVGRITLNRPDALGAVTLPMIRALAKVLPEWASDSNIAMVVIDSVGEKAFSAGGDIADIYAAFTKGDFDTARRFWREEYPVNALLARFPKPVVSFMQGFTMGGGVGVGCHASHRVVGDSSKIAMPECGIGLVPDVGGSLLLARAPGHIGEYLGTSAYRMGPGDAIFAGFADLYIPEADWPDVIAALEASESIDPLTEAAMPPPASTLTKDQARIDKHFAEGTMTDILASLKADPDWGADVLKRLAPNAPLSMAAALELVRAARSDDDIASALRREYRFAHRIAAQGDFREGIRAAIIDKDRSPAWAHSGPGDASAEEVAAMLAPLGDDELELEDPK